MLLVKALIDTIVLQVRYYLVKMKIHIFCEQAITLLDVFSRDHTHVQ